MSSNRTAKRELERIFGKGCFFNRARIEDKIELIGGIKTFKTFEKEVRYKGIKISHHITYHHLLHRSEGGLTTLNNGANLEEIAHQYIHSLPREEEELINNMLRNFKINYLVMTGQTEIIENGIIRLEPNIDFITIPVYNYSKEEREESKDEEFFTK